MFRSFSKTAAEEESMAGRYKPKKILNFDNQGKYLIYNSDFARAGRAKNMTHPKVLVSILALIASAGIFVFGVSAFNRLCRGNVLKQKFRFALSVVATYFFMKQLRRAYNFN